MSTNAYALRDSATMLRRNLLHARRYPSLTLMLIGLPVIFLLLFVYVFGGALGAGIGGGGRAEYANYVTPGILMIAIGGVAQGTAIGVAMDMTEGIIARFRAMAIFRPSVLTGHVLGSLIQTMFGLAVVIGIAIAVGFRPTARHGLVRGHLGRGRLRPVRQVRRDGEQPADAADAAAVPGQRVRPDRLDADRVPVVRRVPAVHPGHGDPAGTDARHGDRQQRDPRGCLVRGDLGGLLPVVAPPLQPRPGRRQQQVATSAAGCCPDAGLVRFARVVSTRNRPGRPV
jgi:hypothetical protein